MPQKTKTVTPTQTDTDVDPHTRYNPERLCPSQRKDAERHARP